MTAIWAGLRVATAFSLSSESRHMYRKPLYFLRVRAACATGSMGAHKQSVLMLHRSGGGSRRKS